ncbi:30S ribosome-binding factor RbfA [candidate division KSB1 bacterium]|nr:30S ribosome-binding factor RbfA [candidate division KSB1 bacterium]
MMHYKRADRVAALLQQMISEYLLQDSGNPIFQRLTITRTKLSRDLKHAVLYYSVLGDEELKTKMEQNLQESVKTIRMQVASKLDLRYVPEIRFFFDDSIEYAAHIEELLKKIKK